nr:transposase (putative), gypsy type [Tanacetum cinerariifolium]
MSFSKRPGKNTPQCYTKPLDSLKNWNNRFFWVDERVFPTIMDWRTNAPKDEMPAENTYSVEAVRALDTHRTPIQKQPEMLLCLVEISRRYYLGDEVYPTFLHDDDRDMDLFNLIRALNPIKVKIGSPPRAAHEVPLLTLTANRVVEMEDPAATTDSSGVPSTIKRSPLDFANEAGASDQGTMALEVPSPEDVLATSALEAGQAKEVAATDPSAATESRKRGKSLAAIELGLASTRPVPVPENAPTGVSDPDPLSFADSRSCHPTDVAQSSQGTAAAGDPESGNGSFASTVGSSESIYRPQWGVANGSMLDTPEAIQREPSSAGGDGVTAVTIHLSLAVYAPPRTIVDSLGPDSMNELPRIVWIQASPWRFSFRSKKGVRFIPNCLELFGFKPRRGGFPSGAIKE